MHGFPGTLCYEQTCRCHCQLEVRNECKAIPQGWKLRSVSKRMGRLSTCLMTKLPMLSEHPAHNTGAPPPAKSTSRKGRINHDRCVT